MLKISIHQASITKIPHPDRYVAGIYDGVVCSRVLLVLVDSVCFCYV